MRQFELANFKNKDNKDVLSIKESKIDLAHGGEITLGQNDKIEMVLSDLGGLQNSNMYTFEGRKASPFVYEIKERTFRSDQPELKLDLSTTDFLVLDSSTLPSEIEFRVGTQKIVSTPETLLIDQKDKFNTIGYDESQKPIFGTYKAVVLDVRNCSEVTMEDESNPRKDIKYHTVKIPR